MNQTLYLAVFVLIMIIFFLQDNSKKVLVRRFIKTKNKEGRIKMFELSKQFIGKECVIYTFNSEVVGIIKEISAGAILLQNKNTAELINLDFVVRIREYPTGKSKKKKSLVLD